MFDNNHDLWASFNEGELMACDQVCGYAKNRQCNVNTWWWNSGVKDDIQGEKKHIKQ